MLRAQGFVDRRGSALIRTIDSHCTLYLYSTVEARSILNYYPKQQFNEY